MGSHLDGEGSQFLLVDGPLINGVGHRQVDHLTEQKTAALSDIFVSGWFFSPARYRWTLPENDSISHGCEQVVAAWVHWQDVFAVAVFLQSFVDPVDEGHLLLL